MTIFRHRASNLLRERFSGNTRAFVHYLFILTVMSLYGGQV